MSNIVQYTTCTMMSIDICRNSKAIQGPIIQYDSSIHYIIRTDSKPIYKRAGFTY